MPGQPGDPAEGSAQVGVRVTAFALLFGPGFSEAPVLCPTCPRGTPAPFQCPLSWLLLFLLPRLPAGSRRQTRSACGMSTGAWWRACGRPALPGKPTPTWPTPCCRTRCCRVSRCLLRDPLCVLLSPGVAADSCSPQRRCQAPSARPSTSWASCGGCWSTSSGGCARSTWCRRAPPPSSAAWRSACASSASPSGSTPRSARCWVPARGSGMGRMCHQGGQE